MCGRHFWLYGPIPGPLSPKTEFLFQKSKVPNSFFSDWQKLPPPNNSDRLSYVWQTFLAALAHDSAFLFQKLNFIYMEQTVFSTLTAFHMYGSRHFWLCGFFPGLSDTLPLYINILPLTPMVIFSTKIGWNLFSRLCQLVICISGCVG